MLKLLTYFLILKCSSAIVHSDNINKFCKPEFNKNILPISKDNAINMCHEWKMQQPEFDHNDKNIFNFIDYINNKKPLIYQWIPNENNCVKALIPVKLENNKINIIGIFPNPNINFFNNKLVKDHLEELKLNNEYKNYEISYENFRNYD